MDIWTDRVILKIIEQLKNRQRKNIISTKRDLNLVAPRFVFICGKAFEEGTETIREVAIKKFDKVITKNNYEGESHKVLCIVSEYLYTQDLANDIFSFEKMLAELSHKIIIVTESAGTFCELGAFVMDNECCNKILVVNENIKEYKESFISKGPIKLLEEKDERSVIIHNGIERLKFSSEFNQRIEDIAHEDMVIPINDNADALDLRGLIYELANIVEMFQPVEHFEIEQLYKLIKEIDYYKIERIADHKIKTLKRVIFLMEKMQVLHCHEGYCYMNRDISCFNVMFRINRKEFNDFRIQYLNRLQKYFPERMNLL